MKSLSILFPQRLTKPSGLVSTGLLAVWVAAQVGQFTVVDRRTDPQIILKGDQATGVLGESFDLKGRVSYENKLARIKVACDRATGQITKETIDGKTREVPNNVVLTGISNFQQDVIDENGSTSTIRVVTTTAKYNNRSSKEAQISLPNPAKITSTSGGTGKTAGTWEANGQAAEVLVSRYPAKGEDSFRTIELSGPVTLLGTRVVNVEGKNVTQKFVAKAQNFQANLTGANREVRLSGNLDLQFADDAGEDSQMTGAQTMILTLNAKNEVSKIALSTDAPGKIRTIKRAATTQKPGTSIPQL